MNPSFYQNVIYSAWIVFCSPAVAAASLSTISTEAAKHNAAKDDAACADDVSAPPSSSHDASRSMYNKQATNWKRTEPRCLSDFTGRPVVFEMLQSVLQGSDMEHRTILDVGCGEGYCARKAIELGATKVVGLDISQEMIASAKETSLGDNRFHYYVSPIGDLSQSLRHRWDDLGIDRPTPEQAFDVAMAVFLFNYLTISDMEDAILQIYQALKPGGVFIFSVPHPSMIFAHKSDSAFHLDSKGKGYYSSRDQQILGQISTIDGVKLNIMSIHKTLGDYISAINKAGFQIQDVREAGVTDEHLALHPEFFENVKDRPLHLIFQLRK